MKSKQKETTDEAADKAAFSLGEVRHTTFPMRQIKLADADSEGRREFEGYASVFGNRDSQGDIVVKGAFTNTLQEKDDVKVLWQHDTHQPIGKMVAAVENDYGLLVRARLSNTKFVKDEVMPLIEDGVVSGLSIGYEVKNVEESDEGYLLTELGLHEFSAVTFPANEQAKVTAVKELGGKESMHIQSLLSHAKGINHELANCVKEQDLRQLDGVSLDVLGKAGALLRGRLAHSGQASADDVKHLEDEAIFLAGFNAGMELLQGDK